MKTVKITINTVNITINELQNGPALCDMIVLNCLFNPLTSDLNRYLIRSEDIDPDVGSISAALSDPVCVPRG